MMCILELLGARTYETTSLISEGLGDLYIKHW